MMSDIAIDASLITKAYNKEFFDYISSIRDTKTIVCDEAMVHNISLFTNKSSMKSAGVDTMTFLDNPTHLKTQNVIFVVRPQLSLMEKLSACLQRITRQDKETNKNKFHILFIPQRSLACEKKLKDLDILHHIQSIDELPMNIVPLDNDILTMNLDHAFRECYLEKVPSCLLNIAKSLMFIQSLYGIIPNILGKGDMANRVIDILMRLRKENEPDEPDVSPKIDNLLIIDRMVDPVTPLMTQMTYEGLIDESFGINKGFVTMPVSASTTKDPPPPTNPFETPSLASSSSSSPPSSETKKIPLNSSEQLYADLRDLHVNAVWSLLFQRAKTINAEKKELDAARSVDKLKEYATKLPHMLTAKTSLSTHLSIAEPLQKIVNDINFREWLLEQQSYLEGKEIDKSRPMIEEAILKNEPLIKVLRMICLQCFCNDGFKSKVIEFYCKELIQSYGYHHIATLANLEKVGLLRSQDQTKTFQNVSKIFKLFVPETKEQNPDDISYVYSSYAPLSVRLAQLYNKLNWQNISEAFNDILPGKFRAENQSVPNWLQRDNMDDQGKSQDRQKVTLVFFVGGVTFAEVSAFRFLSHQEENSTKYMIATTNIMNGTSWLESLSENLKKESSNPFMN